MGRLTRRRPGRSDALGDAAMLPLANLVFLLLTLFVVAGRLAEPQALMVAPPVRPDGAAEDRPTELVVELAADGRLAVGGEELSREAGLARIAETAPIELRLIADRAGQAGRTVALLGDIRRLGIEHVFLVMEMGP